MNYRALARFLALVSALAACAPPIQPTAGGPSATYVLNGADATVSVLDSPTGRVIGSPFSVAPKPIAIAAGPQGSLLFLSSTEAGLVLVHRRPGAPSRASRRVTLDVAGRDGLLTSAGGRYAAVAYRPASHERHDDEGARCRLAVIDVIDLTVRRFTVCSQRELVRAIAIEGDPGSSTVYLGIWRWWDDKTGDGSTGPPASAGGRVVALDGRAGSRTGLLRLDGIPVSLALAPAPAGSGRRLYAAVQQGTDEGYDATGRGRLIGLDPLSLTPQWELDLPGGPRRLAVAADGRFAYVLRADGGALAQVDLAGGGPLRLVHLPGTALDLAVTAELVYLPNPYGREVWAVDPRRGHPAQTIAVGRNPLGIAVAGAG